MSRHAAPRVRHKRPWAPIAGVVAGALVVAGGLWLTFDPSAGDSPPGPLSTSQGVMPTGTPTPSGSTGVTSPTPKPSPSTQKPKPTTPASRPSSSTPTPTPIPPAPRPSTTPPRPPVTPSPSTSPVSITNHALYLINGERNEVGAPMVAVYSGMGGYCQDWADEMARADVLVHSPHNPYSAEVIASGAETASQAVQLWMNSPPHREIILNPAYRKVGIGYSDGYWCAVFSE